MASKLPKRDIRNLPAAYEIANKVEGALDLSRLDLSKLPFSPLEREQAVATVRELAINLFEDDHVAEEWLKEANLATDNKPPITFLSTPHGFKRVTILLNRIEYGILA